MNSLEDSANRVAEAYKSFKIEDTKLGKHCSYNPHTDEITLSFETIKRYLDIFKILHELAHRDQRDVALLYSATSLIELNANKIASEAYQLLGYPLTYEVTRYINYNNLYWLNSDLTQRDIMRKIAGKKELIWRLPA
jgi:hypothetical protein